MDQFLEQIQEDEKVWLVISGVKYVDSEGQRNVRLVHEAMKKGIKIIFVYWRWEKNEPINEPTTSMLEIPLDYFYEVKSLFFEKYLKDHKNKLMLVEFPHQFASELIDIANCFGWITIYDVIDDWEEFSKKGQAIWYDKKVESRIVNCVDINIATAQRLKEKMLKGQKNSTPYYVISNGVDPGRIQVAEKEEKYNYAQGDVQIGYFGHLTDAWYDWDLVIKMAKRHPEWTFHIIGYGEPKDLKVPKNIILYGKKKPDELAKYAAYWDVAIIPFINCELTLSVNPIKIYEYLQLKLPVVASNMPEVSKAPYTQIAIGLEEFETAIKKALDMKLDDQVIESFVLANTWEKKCEEVIQCADKYNAKLTYKQLL